MLSEITIQSDATPKGMTSYLLQQINSIRTQPQKPVSRIIQILQILKNSSLLFAGIQIKQFSSLQADILANHLKQLLKNKILLSQISQISPTNKNKIKRSYSFQFHDIKVQSIKDLLLASVLEQFRFLRSGNSGSLKFQFQDFTPQQLLLFSNNFSQMATQTHQLSNGNIDLKLHFFSSQRLLKSKSSVLPLQFQSTQLKQIKKNKRIIATQNPLPFGKIVQMVRKLDLDQDQRITAEDIKRQFQKQQLAAQEDIHVRMFQDAKKIRTLSRQMDKPLSAQQIYITMKVKKKKINGQWQLYQNCYRPYWSKLLYFTTGYNTCIVRKIEDNSPSSQTTALNNKGINVRNIKQPMIKLKNYPQAGIIVNNTHKIAQLNISDNIQYKPPLHIFQKIINSKVQQSNHKTTTFVSKMYYQQAEKLSLNQKASKAAEDIQKFIPSVFNAGQYQLNLAKLQKHQGNFLLAESTLEQKDIQWLEDAMQQKSLVFTQPQKQFRQQRYNNSTSKIQNKMQFLRPQSLNSLKMRLAKSKWQKQQPEIGKIEGIPIIIYPKNDQTNYQFVKTQKFRQEIPVKNKQPFQTAIKLEPLKPVKYQPLVINKKFARSQNDSGIKNTWINYFKIPDLKHSIKGDRFQNMGKCNFCCIDGKIAHYSFKKNQQQIFYCKRCAMVQLENGISLTGLKNYEQSNEGLLGILRGDQIQQKPFKLVFKPLSKEDRCNLGQI